VVDPAKEPMLIMAPFLRSFMPGSTILVILTMERLLTSISASTFSSGRSSRTCCRQRRFNQGGSSREEWRERGQGF
jgi:hypothetical protein